MSRFLIEGGHKIRGTVKVNGAKNSVLPILAGTLLCKKCVLHNCPELSDVAVAKEILTHLGCVITSDGATVTVVAEDIKYSPPPKKLMCEMRSSILFLGVILARCKTARIWFPGGCELGARPIDMHIDGLRRLGAEIKECHGYLKCDVKERLVGCNITLPFPSVGATENLMLAASTAQGRTCINNFAREPEILDLANFLNQAGADIEIHSDMIVINGVLELNGCEHRVISDRIEATTLLCAAAITGGEITLQNVVAEHMTALLPIFEEMGCTIKCENDEIHLKSPAQLRSIKSIKTMPYPGFPTDAQAPVMAVLSKAQGSSVFVENIFDSRYKHVPELLRLGASIQTEGKVAIVHGVEQLYNASVCCTDLRGGAALVIAALATSGVTEISDIAHIDRGYAKLEEVLTSLGAKIQRIS